jgi:multicomponent Na+:H+ antiporter subunit G
VSQETRTLVVDVLLGIGVGLELLCCVGVLAMRSALDRLHYAGAGSTLPALVIAAAVVVEEKLNSQGITAVVVALVLFLLNPMVTSATARAAAVRGREGP